VWLLDRNSRAVYLVISQLLWQVLLQPVGYAATALNTFETTVSDSVDSVAKTKVLSVPGAFSGGRYATADSPVMARIRSIPAISLNIDRLQQFLFFYGGNRRRVLE
jgi:hypothetical protein